MLISLRWLNTLLNPGTLTAEEADQALTAAGFPLESIEQLPDGDARLDVEVTSNRGDVLSHLGAAREVAAVTGRELLWPQWEEPARSGDVSEALSLENEVPELCPLFTAQVIRGVIVGPSPRWLIERLEAVGQRSINNVVDITNYITFELGHPCHVFDLARLAGAALIVRHADEGELLTTLDGKQRRLVRSDVVVADAERAQSLAGVMGGRDSEVSETTRDIVFEMATWDPVAVRTASRRLAIRTDASHRFERGVAPSEIARAAFRAVAMIQQIAGGTVCEGVLEDGAEQPDREPIRLRPDRVRAILGVDVSTDRQRELLERIEVSVEQQSDGFLCTAPAFRLDLHREIDLIEEIARLNGFDAIPLADRVGIALQHPSQREKAQRELSMMLTSMGFYETVTFSFTSPQRARAWLRPGLRTLQVDDERRGSEPVLRPSVLSGLITCRRSNQDAQVRVEGGVRLFEIASGFAEHDRHGRDHIETPTLALLADVPVGMKGIEAAQAGVRRLRGVIEALIRHVAGTAARVTIEQTDPPCPAWASGATGRILLEGAPLGLYGLLSEQVRKDEGIDLPVVMAELDLRVLLDAHATPRGIAPLPQFPPIERDLTLDLPEQTRWAQIESLASELRLERMISIGLVGVYRGKQTGSGRKSVTARMVFRDEHRTLRREEVDPAVDRLVAAATERLGAAIRH